MDNPGVQNITLLIIYKINEFKGRYLQKEKKNDIAYTLLQWHMPNR